MKKILFALSAVALLFATSCKKDQNAPENPTLGAGEFLATIDNGANPQNAPVVKDGMTTKTKIDANRYVIWEAGDQISINGSLYTTQKSGNSVVFSGGDATGTTFHAFYPALIAITDNTGALPPTQIIECDVQNNIKVSNLPMYATSTDNQLTFHNICAALKITIPSFLNGATSIVVSSNERMNGTFTVVGDSAKMETAPSTDADKKVTISKASGTFATGEDIYIAVPAQAYTDFKIEFFNNTTSMWNKTLTSCTFRVNKVYTVNVTPSDIPVNCFHFTACANNDTIGMTHYYGGGNTPLNVSLEYCTYTSSTGAYSTWDEFTIGTTKVVLSNGDKVYFRAGASGNTAFGSFISPVDQWYNYFTASGGVTVGGNIMYLLNANGQGTLYEYAFFALFHKMKTLTSAEDLELPATTLSKGCYHSMFRFCENLTKAPKKLPATALKEICYQQMFYVTKIDAAPEMTVNSVENSSCNGMFQKCKYMTDASKINLAATTLAESCYNSMFCSDSLLTSGPELNAATLAKGCYQMMFRECFNLSSVTMKATDVSAQYCLVNWLKDAGTLVTTGTTPTVIVHYSTTTTSSAWYSTINTNTPAKWAIKAEGASSNLRDAQ